MRIYSEVVSIRARKQDGQPYVHDFESPAEIHGRSDGSVVIKGRKPLWGTDRNGETWLANPSLAVYVNPKRKRRKKMARRRSKRTGQYLKGGSAPRRRRSPSKRRRRAPARRRRRRRRNPGNPGLPPLNPPRRRRGRRRFRFAGLTFPPMQRLAGGVAGMALARMAPGYLGRMLPMLPTAGVPGLAVRAATAVLLGQVASQFMGRTIGEDVAYGGMLSVADDAVQMYVLPQLGIGAYLDQPGMGAYLEHGAELGQYLSPGARMPAMPEEVFEASGGGDAMVSRLDANQRL